MTTDYNTLVNLSYDLKEIQIVFRDDGTVDMWRHDGEATAEVYEDLSTDWLSRATNERGEEVRVHHETRYSAIVYAVELITCYHTRWSTLQPPPITVREWEASRRARGRAAAR